VPKACDFGTLHTSHLPSHELQTIRPERLRPFIAEVIEPRLDPSMPESGHCAEFRLMPGSGRPEPLCGLNRAGKSRPGGVVESPLSDHEIGDSFAADSPFFGLVFYLRGAVSEEAHVVVSALFTKQTSCYRRIIRLDLSAYGVAFISLRDNLDLSTPSGRLMMHIIGAMAQFERELIKERVSAGMHAARKRGSRIGRPRAYANADKIRALRAQDVPWRTIAAQLGIGTGTAIRAVQSGGAA
jgi:hypothetical protein